MAGKPGMHASRSPTYEAAVRNRIRAGQIVKQLSDHVFGKVELSSTQVAAGVALLRKVIADKTESKTDLTVRRVESLSEQQARMMAEEYVDRAQRITPASPPEPVGVHDSLQAGLQTSTSTPQDS